MVGLSVFGQYKVTMTNLDIKLTYDLLVRSVSCRIHLFLQNKYYERNLGFRNIPIYDIRDIKI